MTEDTERHQLLESVKKSPLRQGKNDLIAYLQGKNVTWGRLIRAKCYDCNGMGESDICDIKTCPLYPLSPYTKKARSGLTRHS